MSDWFDFQRDATRLTLGHAPMPNAPGGVVSRDQKSAVFYTHVSHQTVIFTSNCISTDDHLQYFWTQDIDDIRETYPGIMSHSEAVERCRAYAH